jgi:hypothetical protein
LGSFFRSGVSVVEPFQITQRERWYQSPAFLPSAAAAALGLVGLGFAGQHRLHDQR